MDLKEEENAFENCVSLFCPQDHKGQNNKGFSRVSSARFFHKKLDFRAMAQWIQSFFNSFASTALAISAKLLLKYPFKTFVKAKT